MFVRAKEQRLNKSIDGFNSTVCERKMVYGVCIRFRSVHVVTESCLVVQWYRLSDGSVELKKSVTREIV